MVVFKSSLGRDPHIIILCQLYISGHSGNNPVATAGCAYYESASGLLNPL